MADQDPFVELRFKAPRTVVQVLDAVSLNRRIERHELVNQILAEWADDRMREATAIMRLARDDA